MPLRKSLVPDMPEIWKKEKIIRNSFLEQYKKMPMIKMKTKEYGNMQDLVI